MSFRKTSIYAQKRIFHYPYKKADMDLADEMFSMSTTTMDNRLKTGFKFHMIVELVNDEDSKKFSIHKGPYGKEYILPELRGVVLKYVDSHYNTEFKKHYILFSVKGMTRDNSNELMFRQITNRSMVSIGMIYEIIKTR